METVQGEAEKGFREIAHTADWAIHVWAPDLPALFVESARGVNALSGARLAEGPRVTRTFEAAATDEESLLVIFLSELVYLAEQEKLAFDQFKISIEEECLHAEMDGAPIESLTKAIKAVTFHNMLIRKTARGVEVEIVFDV